MGSEKHSGYLTNFNGVAFCITNLSEGMKGMLLSEYITSKHSIKHLIEKVIPDTAHTMVIDAKANVSKSEVGSVQYKLTGAHLVIENCSFLFSGSIGKQLDCGFIKSAPLITDGADAEFYKDPVLLTSAYKNIYEKTCQELIDWYKCTLPVVENKLREKFESEGVKNCDLLAKAVSTSELSGILPCSVFSKVIIYGSLEFFSSMIRSTKEHSLSEFKSNATEAAQALKEAYAFFDLLCGGEENGHPICEHTLDEISLRGKISGCTLNGKALKPGVSLIDGPENGNVEITSALIFERGSNCGMQRIREVCKNLERESIEDILDTISSCREQLGCKAPMPYSEISFSFEIISDYTTFLEWEVGNVKYRQPLSCGIGYEIPRCIKFDDIDSSYKKLMNTAKAAYDEIASQFPEEVQYVVPMGCLVRWYLRINLRDLQEVCESKTNNGQFCRCRHIAQDMAKLVSEKYPHFGTVFKFVDYSNGGFL